ncbi:hypothetical protein CAPTEDRAFT_221179 [Capitella teleta]|uniref:C2 domain-containing protein n=1 Tax=Capitella teleta TaxID=283909 RepID=R7T545_CAPTE|nr:hypothetical protein CAPTEDRAFT_221179 [Capitella teleta]|eukprot:ELT88133.1 hypothetical protein CAPTEDRAFT_221179 [Capitella teleta]
MSEQFPAWWMFSASSISDLIKKNLDPILNDVKPAFIESIELDSFSLGSNTPFIKYIQVFECFSGEGGVAMRRPASWAAIIPAPANLSTTQQFQIVLEADLGLQCEDFRMVFRTRLGGKWMGMDMDAAVEKLHITGKMHFLLNMDMNCSFPHISSVTLSFLEKPEVWFAIRMLKAVQMMEIPVLKSWIHHLVLDGLTTALVDPGKWEIRMESVGPTKIPARPRHRANAQGVLTVTLSAHETKANVFMEDTRYCQLRVGEQVQRTQRTQGPSAWEDCCSFLIDDLKKDKLTIKVKSKVLMSTNTLVQFDVLLSNFPLELKPLVETALEEKVSKRQGGGSVKLLLSLEYFELPNIVNEIESVSAGRPQIEISCCWYSSGVLYVCIHSACGLLGLDRNGFSDPYCVVYSNGKKTMLSFIVYDWDGRNASEDDFLGSSHLLLSQDEPSVIKKSLTLGYNRPNVGQVDNIKLGSIIVSAVFRPVPAVLKSEGGTLASVAAGLVSSEKKSTFLNSALEFGESMLVHTGLHRAISKVASYPSMAVNCDKQRISAFHDKKSSDSMGMGALLSLGHGILELKILQAKNLVAADSNGFSDPYCEVRINNERKFTTSIKKKTLNPVWDEFVTLQLPQPNETLEIVVWDRDLLFKKDFLGSLSFTLDDLKKLSTQKTESWHSLQRIRSGHVQLGITVILGHKEEETGTNGDIDPEIAQSVPLNSLSEESNKTEIISDEKLQEDKETKESAIDVPDAPDDPGISQSNGEGHGPPPSPQGQATQPLKRKFSFRSLRRSSSDTSLKKAETASLSRSTSAASYSLTRRSSSKPSPGLNAEYPVVSGGENYYGLKGNLLQIRGLENQLDKHVYCKVRLDDRPICHRKEKRSIGHVICKTPVLSPLSPVVNQPFEVDQGRGVLKEAHLVIDVKTSHKKQHLANKAFRLDEIMSHAEEVTQWLPLQHGIEVELHLRHTGTASPSPSYRLKNSFGFGRKKKSH